MKGRGREQKSFQSSKDGGGMVPGPRCFEVPKLSWGGGAGGARPVGRLKDIDRNSKKTCIFWYVGIGREDREGRHRAV